MAVRVSPTLDAKVRDKSRVDATLLERSGHSLDSSDSGEYGEHNRGGLHRYCSGLRRGRDVKIMSVSEKKERARIRGCVQYARRRGRKNREETAVEAIGT